MILDVHIVVYVYFVWNNKAVIINEIKLDSH